MKRLVVLVSTALLAAAVPAALPAVAEEGPDRPLTAADAAAGKPLYVQECSACHGERGDGKGPAAAFIEPKPRDFVRAPFRLRSTPAGKPPATDDILRTIERGVPGTAMPSFAFLPPDDRRRIAAYVLKLADLLDEPEPPTVRVDAASAPPATPQSIARGKELFADAGCSGCHGETGKGDGPTAGQMKDEAGNPVKPRDFSDGRFRGGAERADLYLRLSTGMDGTPMPAYDDVLEPADRWAVVDYVRTLASAPQPAPLPRDPLEAGRRVAEKYSCRACHVLDDGKGGDAGPDLRLSGQKLDPAWVKKFLVAPRAPGKIYPWRPSRMPDLGISQEEAAVLTAYLAAVGRRPETSPARPDPTKFPPDKIQAGKTLFVVTCAQCHSLGKVIETQPINQQGPDLIRAAERVDYEWAKSWISDPKKYDAKTRMVIAPLSPDQVEAVRMFVWSAALGAAPGGAGKAAAAAGASGTAQRPG